MGPPALCGKGTAGSRLPPLLQAPHSPVPGLCPGLLGGKLRALGRSSWQSLLGPHPTGTQCSRVGSLGLRGQLIQEGLQTEGSYLSNPSPVDHLSINGAHDTRPCANVGMQGPVLLTPGEDSGAPPWWLRLGRCTGTGSRLLSRGNCSPSGSSECLSPVRDGAPGCSRGPQTGVRVRVGWWGLSPPTCA